LRTPHPDTRAAAPQSYFWATNAWTRTTDAGAGGSTEGRGGGARAPEAEADDDERARPLLLPLAVAVHKQLFGAGDVPFSDEDAAWLEDLDYVDAWAEHGGGGVAEGREMVKFALHDAATGVSSGCSSLIGPDDPALGQPISPDRCLLLALAAVGVANAQMAPSFLQQLLSAPCADDGSGNRPLHLAAARGDERVACVLMLAGAPLDVQNAAGLSAFHEAAAQLRYRLLALWPPDDKARQLRSRAGDGSGPTV
jgi:hypothetical protein